MKMDDIFREGWILNQGITDKCIMEHEIDLTILILRKGCEKFS